MRTHYRLSLCVVKIKCMSVWMEEKIRYRMYRSQKIYTFFVIVIDKE